MSGNYDKESVLDGSGADGNGGGGSSNGRVRVESSVGTSQPPSAGDGAAETFRGEEVVVIKEPVDVAHMPDSVNQGPGSRQVEPVSQVNGVLMTDSIQDDPDSIKMMEDGPKEDMFVDCSDELVSYDVRNSDNREPPANSEVRQGLEEKSDNMGTGFHESDNGRQGNDSMEEMEHLQRMFEKAVAEKDTLAREYKEERETFMKELTYLHHQLKALNEHPSLLDRNDNELVDRLQKAELGEREEKTMISPTSLQEMINECSKHVKSSLDERQQTEGMFRELQSILFTKDEEIGDLHAKVIELSLSKDVVVSFLNSTQRNWSESLKELSMVQLENDQFIDATASRLLTSLAGAVDQEELLHESVVTKISQVERKTSILIDKYNQILSEINLLRQCLTEERPDLNLQNELQTTFVAARDELLELRRKGVELAQKIHHLEDENKSLLEQHNKEKEMAELANAEIGKLKVELEQEKIRYTNTKEKLSLAVTRGKALVQQRDSLKQSVAEKTSELDKCLIELRDKSAALQETELSVVKSENSVASLQEAISQRDSILKNCEEILFETGVPEEFQSVNVVERLRWLVGERNALMSVSVEFHRLKDALSSFDSQENISSSDLESSISWLMESFSVAKAEASKLQDEISRAKNDAYNVVDCLTLSLLDEIQEKYYLHDELADLTHKYECISEKEIQMSLEKDHMVSKLLEACGITMDYLDEVSQPPSGMTMIIEQCLAKVKEQSITLAGSSRTEAEMFEKIQTLLYIKYLEVMLYEEILEELLDRSEVNSLLNELRAASQELQVLKDDRSSLQKDFELSEEKYALLREKLSMAVKKGKGLVQERENLKQLLAEKETEIQKLKVELKQQESAFGNCRDQLNKLTTDVECIPKLEADIIAMKEQKLQIEQFLAESNSMLQRMIESIDNVFLPFDATFEDPVEKVKWITKYLNECQVEKAHAEQELEKVEMEVNSLANKLAEAYKAMKSLEDTLSVAEKNISLLTEEKKELEAGKKYREQELQKAMEDASSHAGKFAELCATKKSLEDALSLAENNVSMLINEKENTEINRSAAETEAKKLKEEVSIQNNKLADACRTIKSLEDALSQAETSASLLAEENNNMQVERTNLENEMKKLKEETDSHAGKLGEVYSTIKSMEESLLKAENNISELVEEKKNAEQLIATLNSKLNACMEELAGAHGNLESRSLELCGYVNGLQLFLKDETLLSLMRKCFEKNFASLKNLDFHINELKNLLIELDLEMLQNQPIVEEDSCEAKMVYGGCDDVLNVKMDEYVVNAADGDDIPSQFGKTVEGFQLRNKILENKIEGFSASMDDCVAALLTKLQKTKVKLMDSFEYMKSLKKKMYNMEMDRQAQENTIAMLENDIKILLSACSNATQELEIEIESHLVEKNSASELEKLNQGLFTGIRKVDGDATAGHQHRLDSSMCVNSAEKLLFTARKVQALTKQFESLNVRSSATIEELQNHLKETGKALENAMEEKDSVERRVSNMESEIKALNDSCDVMRCKLESFQGKEDKLKEREADLSSLYNISLTKEKEVENPLLSASQVKYLFDKIDGIEIPVIEFEVGDPELCNSATMKKLFFIIDTFPAMHEQINLLSHDKEELQSTLAEQVSEIEQLKEEYEEQIRNGQDYGRMSSELSELASGLENIVQKLGGTELIGDQKSAGVRGLLPVLEKLVTAIILESENSKSKAQELGVKLLESQNLADELSAKVKFLKDSNQSGFVSPEIVQERRIFETPPLPARSEISETEDVGPLGKKAISPVPSAAHVRTLRKGSNDHLAINVDMETDRLINNEETDEDKGHVFRSLNTSGLIPRQGKMIADRIDGIWVSGGRALMSRPVARLGLIAYWLFLHMWLLGSIL